MITVAKNSCKKPKKITLQDLDTISARILGFEPRKTNDYQVSSVSLCEVHGFNFQINYIQILQETFAVKNRKIHEKFQEIK